MITYHIKEKPVHTLIAVGGVMSNSLLRKRMETYCKTESYDIACGAATIFY